jgi:signal transduction histidine kinase
MLLIKIAIIVSIIMHVVAAILAISLVKTAKYNVSWIFLTLAFLLMAARQVIAYFPYVYRDISERVAYANTWVGIFISALIVISLIFIKKLFNMIKKGDEASQEVEKRVLSAIINTEENERQRFAKDLHDGLGPLLSNLKMSVSTLENISEREEMNEILENMKTVAQEAISSIKEVSNNLSPHILENFGLQKAIEVFIKPIGPGCNLAFKINSTIHEERFAYNIEIILYRVLTELINNTVKHANATKVTIDLIKKENFLHIRYNDDGKGSKVMRDTEPIAGLGLANIQSRLKTLNGTVIFTSKPRNGFTAEISCPF